MCPVSGHPSLQLEVLPLTPILHVFWFRESLNLGCTAPRTSPPTPFLGNYSGDLQAPSSLLQRHACSTVNLLMHPSYARGVPGGVDQFTTARFYWTPPCIGHYHHGWLQGVEPPTALVSPFQPPFDLLSNIQSQGPHIPLLPIHSHLPPRLIPLLHLIVLCPENQCLSVDWWGSEVLTAVLWCLKAIRCSLGEVWYLNSRPLQTPDYMLVGGFSDLLSTSP